LAPEEGKMIRYRDHRGSLDDSMATIIELADRAALIAHLRSIYDQKHFGEWPDAAVKVKPYCYDERIDWDTYIVTLNDGAVGFTDGPVPNK
jgi:hypothetical protein